ncbi:hypothetical protein BLNAU_14953 [Blattamonas nauphoetae]|uniref:Uncharacterized protein n=1 Tax=Blattamonas nauphoetae TaxID=2049346 RepID=A0ABQ9XCA6_9EUKA|nr:hypothetical protein BLNAU_14953 [Blattamonas nauphoetae]
MHRLIDGHPLINRTSPVSIVGGIGWLSDGGTTSGKCVLDIPQFVDRTVSALGSSHSLVRLAASSLFHIFDNQRFVIPHFSHLWDRLRSAFRDGRPEEQAALLQMSTTWMIRQRVDLSLPPFPASQFDWDGLISADYSWPKLFVQSVLLMATLRQFSIDEQIGRAKVIHILLSFEQHQHAVSRINTEFDDLSRGILISNSFPTIISYCLLMSLLSKCDFPSRITTFLTIHPEIAVRTLLFAFDNKLVFLNHTSLNRHKPHQPPLDLIVERAIRTSPLVLFQPTNIPDLEFSPSLRNTALCGFHALCRRGIHIALSDEAYISSGGHWMESFWMFSTHLISDVLHLFLYYPPPLIVRFFIPVLWTKTPLVDLLDGLKVMLTTLLLITAPFGDCVSLREMYRTVRLRSRFHLNGSVESDIAARCESLEWLSIPTGFRSALAHSNTHLSHIPSKNDFGVPPLPSLPPGYLNSKARNVGEEIAHLARSFQTLSPATSLMLSNNQGLSFLCRMMLAPQPTRVSVVLEMVKRVVWMSGAQVLIHTVRFGLIDCVIRAVSESSFLEDYENGDPAIGSTGKEINFAPGLTLQYHGIEFLILVQSNL